MLAEGRDSLILDHENMFKGYASYYANMLHGLRMANGELYHRDSMTCAHLRLPFGTLLMVRNPRNGRSCASHMRHLSISGIFVSIS